MNRQESIDELTIEFAAKIALLFTTLRDRRNWLIIQEAYQEVLRVMDENFGLEKSLEVQKLYVNLTEQIIAMRKDKVQ